MLLSHGVVAHLSHLLPESPSLLSPKQFSFQLFLCFHFQFYLKSRLNCLLLTQDWDEGDDNDEKSAVEKGSVEPAGGAEADGEDLWEAMEELHEKKQGKTDGKKKAKRQADSEDDSEDEPEPTPKRTPKIQSMLHLQL